MRELDLTIADGQQASVGQLRQNRPRTVDALKLAQRHPAAGYTDLLCPLPAPPAPVTTTPPTFTG